MPKPADNPFRPGAGHPPPFLAGREREKVEYTALLEQSTILDNLILTGLRGIGKTVFLDSLKPLAVDRGWLWVGADMSESTSLTEESLSTRLLADLAPLVSNVPVAETRRRRIGFAESDEVTRWTMDYQELRGVYDYTPGLATDKLKTCLEAVWSALAASGHKGLVMAYDEAQNLADGAAGSQHPLSMMLDVFQSLQRKNLPILLVLTGLPNLFPNLVQARTFSERMFHVVTMDRLSEAESRDAIVKPLEKARPAARFSDTAVDEIIRQSAGYPYFIQFFCREIFDSMLQSLAVGGRPAGAPVRDVVRKLDADFFAGRWNRITDRQRDLLSVVADLPNHDAEFTVQEIVRESAKGPKPFSGSQINQMLATLAKTGLVYKNRHGRYSLGVPLLGQFIRRIHADSYR